MSFLLSGVQTNSFWSAGYLYPSIFGMEALLTFKIVANTYWRARES
jgi:hypothetical protein